LSTGLHGSSRVNLTLSIYNYFGIASVHNKLRLFQVLLDHLAQENSIVIPNRQHQLSSTSLPNVFDKIIHLQRLKGEYTNNSNNFLIIIDFIDKFLLYLCN